MLAPSLSLRWALSSKSDDALGGDDRRRSGKLTAPVPDRRSAVVPWARAAGLPETGPTAVVRLQAGWHRPRRVRRTNWLAVTNWTSTTPAIAQVRGRVPRRARTHPLQPAAAGPRQRVMPSRPARRARRSRLQGDERRNLMSAKLFCTRPQMDPQSRADAGGDEQRDVTGMP